MQEYINELLRRWQLPSYIWNLLIVAASVLIGLLISLLLSLFVKKQKGDAEQVSFIQSLLRHLSRPVSWWIPLFTFDLLLPVMRLSPVIRQRMEHATEIGLIIISAWVLIQMIRVGQDVARLKFNIHIADNLRQRRILTQLIYIRRVFTIIISLITIGAVLLTFETMRKVGTGLLTGVGIGGIIIGFAAQRSLGNLLAGFQIAFTQPIRIDDEVVVQGEFGKIEEITLTYVVVKIWDDRRLILPINFFIENPFENWTRTAAYITGTIYIYTDYMLPVDWLRKEFMEMIQHHPLWDKRNASLLVTGAKENVMELRAVVSAKSSGDVWDLRCYLREELIKKINEHYPNYFPRTRLELQSKKTDRLS
jgi:small-conductance mechanosensitive channel